MSTTARELIGVIRGRTIELAAPPGYEDGQEVRVVITPKPEARVWGEGIRRSAGCAAGDTAFAAAMEQASSDRKQDRTPPRLDPE